MSRLFGFETEYSDSVLHSQAFLASGGLKTLASEQPVLQNRSHSRSGLDVFLANGARLYYEGCHPEYCTPECRTPDELTAHVVAGDDMVARLADSVSKCNVDYNGNTWGAHESYLHKRVDENNYLCNEMLPHLVSRVIFAGAGGVDPLGGFVLSPRALFFHHVSGGSTTQERAVFTYREEPLCAESWDPVTGFHREYRRMHLICGDSLCSQTAIWLKAATTALVVAMAEAGIDGLCRHLPDDPPQALHDICYDYQASIKTLHGRATALEMQRHLLGLARDNLVILPAWAGQACDRWESILDDLSMGPEAVCNRLDWAIKKPLYERVLKRDDALETVKAWSKARRLLVREARNKYGHSEFCNCPLCHNGLRDFGILSGPTGMMLELLGTERFEKIDPSGVFGALRKIGVKGRDSIESSIQRLNSATNKLKELDIKFGQLRGGIFQELDASGVLDHKVLPGGLAERARRGAPPDGRASLRARIIRHARKKKKDVGMYWDSCAFDGESVNLADPFSAELPDFKEGIRLSYWPGMRVRLGRPAEGTCQGEWQPAMEEHVGAPTKIKELAGVDCCEPCARVEADGGRFRWRLRDMEPIDALREEKMGLSRMFDELKHEQP